jgi:hypothetical protein
MHFRRLDITTELSEAGGPGQPNRQATWPARFRSSDLGSFVAQEITHDPILLLLVDSNVEPPNQTLAILE